MKINIQGKLLTIAAVAEWLAGLAFLLIPSITVNLLLGSEPDNAGIMVVRIGGAALLALGVSCWTSKADSGSAARSGTLWAITLYNAAAGFLLILFGATGMASGIMIWVAGAFHAALAVGFAVSLRR